MWTWFADVPNAVKDFVLSGKLGRIKDVYMSYCAYSVGYAPRVSDPLLGGGALLDIGIYPITYAYRLFGFPRSIVCNGDIESVITQDYLLTDVDSVFDVPVADYAPRKTEQPVGIGYRIDSDVKQCTAAEKRV